MTTILLADDEPMMRGLLRSALHSLGHEMIEAVDGTEALLLARRRRPALVVLDGQMPGLDGWTVCRALKTDAATNRMLVLLITGSPDQEAEERALQAGADGFFRKPFSPTALREKVLALLR